MTSYSRMLSLILLLASQGSKPANAFSPRMLDPKSASWAASSIVASSFSVPVMVSSPFLQSLESATTTLSTTTGAADPVFFESEILGDLAHVSLDLFTFLGPNKIPVRLAAICGRLFAMGADYLPDHKILPEELAFQMLMLFTAWVAFMRALQPVILSSFYTNSTLRDGKVFVSLFKPFGLTWPRYKALRVVASEWMSISPNSTTVEDEGDYIYWLYSGELNVTRDGTSKTVSKDDQAAARLIAEDRLLHKMQKSNKVPARVTLGTSERGATVLKIHVDTLKHLMDNDADLESSMRSLLLHTLQEKVEAQWKTA